MNKKKRITAALDNFPAGKVLVVLVVIVVILQSYSAWKVIGLEGFLLPTNINRKRLVFPWFYFFQVQ